MNAVQNSSSDGFMTPDFILSVMTDEICRDHTNKGSGCPKYIFTTNFLRIAQCLMEIEEFAAIVFL